MLLNFSVVMKLDNDDDDEDVEIGCFVNFYLYLYFYLSSLCFFSSLNLFNYSSNYFSLFILLNISSISNFLVVVVEVLVGPEDYFFIYNG